MCEPTTIILAASLAIAAASAATSAVAANQQADAQEKFQQEQFDAQQRSANKAFIADIEAENARLAEEAARDTDELTKARLAAAENRATARVAAGEAGVAGLSLDALLADLERPAGLLESNQNLNEEFRIQQSMRRRESLEANRQSRLNAARPSPVNRPSALGTALRFGGQAVGSVQSFNQASVSRGSSSAQAAS